MEQGNRLDSTPVSAAQAVRDDIGTDQALDAAVTALLCRPAPEAPERRALIAYASWLSMERNHVCKELYPALGWKAADFVVGMNAGFDFHRRDTPAASTRAVQVLDLIGCDWAQDRDHGIGDGGDTFPQATAFPHPDARLMDLEFEFAAAREAYKTACDREAAACAEFDRREEPYRQAEHHLVLHPGPDPVFWRGDYLRRILSDRFTAVSSEDAAVVNGLSRVQLEALLELVEARDARIELLCLDLRLDDLEAETEKALDACTTASKSIYRLQAKTVEGLALKARILKIDEPGFWKRPNGIHRLPAQWHEVAFAEIADGVEHLIAISGRARTTFDPVAALFDAGNTDPVLAVIEEGRRLLAFSDALHALPARETPEAEKLAEDERTAALRALYAYCDEHILKTTPLTAVGCRELARFANEYAESSGLPISDDEQAIVRLIAASPLLNQSAGTSTTGGAR